MLNKKKWYRKFPVDLDKKSVEAAVANNGGDPSSYSVSSLAGPYLPDDVTDLDGKVLDFSGEGRQYRFEILGDHKLRFSDADHQGVDCYCNVKTMDHEVFLINHLVPGYPCSRQVTMVADTKTGSATICDAHIGTENSNIDVGHEFIFGKLSGDFAEGPMHGFTDELVGTAIQWDYGHLVIKHIYCSNLYYTYSHPGGENGAWMATNPADYVKIRDDLFIFSFVEERQFGLQGFFLIDTKALHDLGVFYGVREGRISSGCVGAIGTRAELTTIF